MQQLEDCAAVVTFVGARPEFVLGLLELMFAAVLVAWLWMTIRGCSAGPRRLRSCLPILGCLLLVGQMALMRVGMALPYPLRSRIVEASLMANLLVVPVDVLCLYGIKDRVSRLGKVLGIVLLSTYLAHVAVLASLPVPRSVLQGHAAETYGQLAKGIAVELPDGLWCRTRGDACAYNTIKVRLSPPLTMAGEWTVQARFARSGRTQLAYRTVKVDPEASESPQVILYPSPDVPVVVRRLDSVAVFSPPVALHLTLLRKHHVRSQVRVTPISISYHPNGEGCEPECQRGEATWRLRLSD